MQTIKGITTKSRSFLRSKNTNRLVFLTLLVLLCMSATYYGHFVLHTDVVYTHLFYIPIALAGYWWGRRAFWVALILSGWLLACGGISLTSEPMLPTLLRCVMFVIVAFVTGMLQERDLNSRRTLEDTRDYLDTLIQHSAGPIIVWDTQRRITLFNAAFERLTGYGADEILGRSLEVLFPDESREETLQAIIETLQGELWEALEISIRCADGRIAICLWNSANIYEPDGETLIATIAQGQDITEQVRAQETLRDSEERFRQMAQVIPAAFWMVSGEHGQTLYISPAFETIYGRSCESIYQEPQLWLEVIHPDDRGRVVAATEEHSGEEHENEYRIIRPDGEVRWIHEYVLPVRNEQGEITHTVGITEGITERKLAEETLHRRDAILKAVSLAAERLLKTADWKQGIEEVLERVGLATNASHVALFENSAAEDGDIITSEISVWRASADTHSSADTQLPADSPPQSCVLAAAGFARWEEILSSGGLIHGNVTDLPPSERDALAPLGIKSTVVVPILIGHVWWGFLVFDDFLTEREWSLAEIDAIKVAGSTLGAAIQRQQAEVARRESQARYRLLAENAADVIWTMDMDLRFTYVSPSATRLSGYSAEEVMAKTIEELLTPDSINIVLIAFAEAMAAEASDSQDASRTWTLELEFIRKDGSNVWAESVMTFLRDEGGRSIGILGVTRDITERQQAEENLRRRDAILEAISLASERLLGTSNWEQSINSVLEQLGLSTEASRVYIFENHPGDDGALLTSQRYEWAAPGIEPQMDNPLLQDLPLRIPGSTRWEDDLSQGYPIHGLVREFPASERELLDARGIKSIAVVPIFVGQKWWGFLGLDYRLAEREWSPVEIDALKAAASALGAAIRRAQAEEEKASLEADLRQSHKMQAIGQLAGGVAHDFNNILTVMQGYIEFALMSIDEDDPVRREINEVRRASVRAANLTRQLLLFSRRQPMAMHPLNINRTVQDLTKMLGRLIGEGITLTTTQEPHLWTIEGDAGTIEQVIMNLVVNARDALPQGGEITIQTQNRRVSEKYCQTRTYAQPGEFVCLSVTDTGTGIEPDIIDRIFEPFFTTKGPGKGTGMGLPVVYGIVKQHGGWIDVESSPGQGTVLEVYLPATITRAEAEPESPVPTEMSRGKGERILLVEDEIDINGLTSRGLSEHGYVVDAVVSAQEAWDVFQHEKEKFDLVCCDLVLSDGSGLKLAQRLLEIRPDTKLIFTSGYSADKADWLVIQEEGYPFLQKPYSLSDLLGVLREVLG